MEKLLEKLSEHFGYAAPFMYAAEAYGLFHWLDENASDEAKVALARTMNFQDYKNEQVASALVEVFDRIYTYPLLHWRAFFRSLLFTTVVFVIYLYEIDEFTPWKKGSVGWRLLTTNLLFNVFSDYLSLFVIRPLLVRSGTKPVIGLGLGAMSGVAIVLVGNLLRVVAIGYRQWFYFLSGADKNSLPHLLYALVPFAVALFVANMTFSWSALVVFVWLLLFALGILIARLLTPLSLIVGRAQWFLKEKGHPLKAIGYVAAVVVFLGTVAGRAVFGA